MIVMEKRKISGETTIPYDYYDLTIYFTYMIGGTRMLGKGIP
jgi:hypothetical protein